MQNQQQKIIMINKTQSKTLNIVISCYYRWLFHYHVFWLTAKRQGTIVEYVNVIFVSNLVHQCVDLFGVLLTVIEVMRKPVTLYRRKRFHDLNATVGGRELLFQVIIGRLFPQLPLTGLPQHSQRFGSSVFAEHGLVVIDIAKGKC